MGTYKVTTEDGQSYKVTTEDAPTDFKQIIGSAMKDSFRKPLAFAKDLATNPETMAKVLPIAAGMAGAISPIPGGATMGTVGGRQISNQALRMLGKGNQIPSAGSQVLEGGLAAIGDVAGIPALKKSIFGKQIGAAETAAGVGGAASEAPPSGARTAVKYIQSLKGKAFSPEEALRVKPAMDWIWKKGWLDGTKYSVEAEEVQKAINEGLKQIPGRAAPSAAMAQSQTIPRAIGNTYKMIPPRVRMGMGLGAGAVGGGELIAQLIKKLLGGQ